MDHFNYTYTIVIGYSNNSSYIFEIYNYQVKVILLRCVIKSFFTVLHVILFVYI